MRIRQSLLGQFQASLCAFSSRWSCVGGAVVTADYLRQFEMYQGAASPGRRSQCKMPEKAGNLQPISTRRVPDSSSQRMIADSVRKFCVCLCHQIGRRFLEHWQCFDCRILHLARNWENTFCLQHTASLPSSLWSEKGYEPHAISDACQGHFCSRSEEHNTTHALRHEGTSCYLFVAIVAILCIFHVLSSPQPGA